MSTVSRRLSQKHSRGYSPWTKDEEKRLLNAFYVRVSEDPESVTLIIDTIQHISIAHERSEGAIAQRLKNLGALFYTETYKYSSELRVTTKAKRAINRGRYGDDVAVNVDVTVLPQVRCDDEVNFSINDFNF